MLIIILTILIIIFIALNIADIILTNKILAQGGREVWKPMIWVMKLLGDKWYYSKFIYTIVLIICEIVLYNISWNVAGLILIALADMLYIWVVLNNYKESKK